MRKFIKVTIFFYFIFQVFLVNAQSTVTSLGLQGNIRRLFTYKHIAKDIVIENNTVISYEKVKLLDHTDYIFEKNGLLLAENKFNEEDIIDHSYIYTFDESDRDRLIETTRARAGKFLIGRAEYKYDKEGKKNQELVYDSQDSLRNTIVYKYDSLGNLISEKTYNANNRVIKELHYQYDEKGNCVLVNSLKTAAISSKVYQEVQRFDERNNRIYKSFIKEDSLAWEYIARYDKKDSLTYEEVRDPEGKIISYSRLKYNHKYGKRISMKQYHQQLGTTKMETYYTYDKAGKLLTEKAYGSNKKELFRIRTYFYDEHGNWIYCVEEDKNNGIYVVYSRRINYF